MAPDAILPSLPAAPLQTELVSATPPAETPCAADVEVIPPGALAKPQTTKRLDNVTIRLILDLAHKGLTQGEVAMRVGVNQSTVSRTLAEWDDTRALAKARLRKGADELAKRVLEKANVAEAITVLTSLDVIQPAQSQADTGVKVFVGINLADLQGAEHGR